MFTWIADALTAVLSTLHTGLEPITGDASWGWAVIVLTMLVRLLMMPLAVRQFHNMQRMQALQPKVAALRKKYATDRGMMRTNPDRYRQRKQKLNEELGELYREAGANPAAGCLPLVVQAPVFITLLRVLRNARALKNAPFYLFTTTAAATAEFHGLGTTVREAGFGGWTLLAAMLLATVMSQRQMAQTRATTAQTPATVQQQMIQYVAPAFMAFVSIGFPIGVLLYWVTSSTWQWAQQAVLLNRLTHTAT